MDVRLSSIGVCRLIKNSNAITSFQFPKGAALSGSDAKRPIRLARAFLSVPVRIDVDGCAFAAHRDQTPSMVDGRRGYILPPAPVPEVSAQAEEPKGATGGRSFRRRRQIAAATADAFCPECPGRLLGRGSKPILPANGRKRRRRCHAATGRFKADWGRKGQARFGQRGDQQVTDRRRGRRSWRSRAPASAGAIADMAGSAPRLRGDRVSLAGTPALVGAVGSGATRFRRAKRDQCHEQAHVEERVPDRLTAQHPRSEHHETTAPELGPRGNYTEYA